MCFLANSKDSLGARLRLLPNSSSRIAEMLVLSMCLLHSLQNALICRGVWELVLALAQSYSFCLECLDSSDSVFGTSSCRQSGESHGDLITAIEGLEVD